MPFLLPLLYQLGLALPAWESGLLMMPAAAAAMGMKVLSAPDSAAPWIRRILVANTVILGRSSACSPGDTEHAR